MRISPEGKTLAIHRVSRYDHNLQCAIEDFREILQRSEVIPLSVACELTGEGKGSQGQTAVCTDEKV